MKKILIASTIVICSMVSFAQQKQSFSISVNGGIASPLGNFKKADYADESSGFAKTGYHLNLTGIYQLNKNWGIGLTVSYSQFGHAGLTSLSDGYKEDSGTDSTTLYANGNNSTFSVLVGPVYKIPLGKKLAVTLRAQGGYSSATLSGFTVYYEDYTDNAMTQNKSTASSFGYQFGAGLNYDLTDKVALLFNADYFSTKPKFDITYDDFVVNSGRKLTTYNEALSSFNATLGIGFRF